eukprot:152494-Pyramimonas_sp.AAC.1
MSPRRPSRPRQAQRPHEALQRLLQPVAPPAGHPARTRRRPSHASHAHQQTQPGQQLPLREAAQLQHDLHGWPAERPLSPGSRETGRQDEPDEREGGLPFARVNLIDVLIHQHLVIDISISGQHGPAFTGEKPE